MKIVVLAGGISTERDVSLSSGRGIYQALKENGHQVILLDIFLGLPDAKEPLEHLFESTIDWAASIRSVSRKAPDLEQIRALRPGYRELLGPNVLKLCSLCDMVFLGLHGTNGEDGRIQALFDLMGIRYTGTGHTSSALCMDKDLTKRLVAGKVKTPRWETVTVTQENLEELAERVELPAVIKPNASGSSVGVYIVKTRADLRGALESSARAGGRVVIEEYIQGREISVAVLGGKALPSIEIVPKSGFYDYSNKYQPGATTETCPAHISSALEKAVGDAALAVFEAIGLAVYARADFMIAPDATPYFLEINTLPGMTPTSLVPQEAAAAGMDYGVLCETIIQKSLEARREGL